uniref:Uncharacterized protein n=1 Tax=Oryza glumipatula TaxID=40148 RepID=A0A0E0BKD3_9ORYZ
MHEYRLAAAGQKKSGNHDFSEEHNGTSRRRASDADGETSVTGVHGHRRQQPSPSPSSSSCVTAEVSDGEEEEEEVSNGSINGAPSASQRRPTLAVAASCSKKVIAQQGRGKATAIA